MASGRWHPSSCKGCGATAAEGVWISATGLCPECGTARVMANVRGLRDHSGEPFARWRRAMAASVGGVLLDESADEA